jgi:hypothetical protein
MYMVWSGKFYAQETANTSNYRNGHKQVKPGSGQHTPANSSFSLGFHGNKEWLQFSGLPRTVSY